MKVDPYTMDRVHTAHTAHTVQTASERQRERKRYVSARIFTQRRAPLSPPRHGRVGVDPLTISTASTSSTICTNATDKYGEKLAYTLWDSQNDNANVPEDVREAFLDFYAQAYEVYIKRWNDGYSSVHYVRKKTIPPFVETLSPRSRTYVHVDLSRLPVDVPVDVPSVGDTMGFTVHRPPFL